MKFYDRLVAHYASMPELNDGPFPIDADKAMVIDISNVARYMEHRRLDRDSLPSMLPPWTCAFWESSYIPDDALNHELIKGYGVMSRVKDIHEHTRDPSSVFREVTRYFNGDYWSNWLESFESFTSPPRFIVSYHLYVDFLAKIHHKVVNRLVIVLDENGQAVGGTDRIDGEHRRLIDWGWRNVDWTPYMTDADPLYKECFTAIGLTHCKNVELVDGQRAEGKLRKKQEKKLGRPLTTFKELVIDPSMTQKRYEGTDIKPRERGTRLLHIARGHFATYSEDKPLFGKYSGTFWKPAHVRGSADVGMVGKDYKVNAPKSP